MRTLTIHNIARLLLRSDHLSNNDTHTSPEEMHEKPCYLQAGAFAPTIWRVARSPQPRRPPSPLPSSRQQSVNNVRSQQPPPRQHHRRLHRQGYHPHLLQRQPVAKAQAAWHTGVQSYTWTINGGSGAEQLGAAPRLSPLPKRKLVSTAVRRSSYKYKRRQHGVWRVPLRVRLHVAVLKRMNIESLHAPPGGAAVGGCSGTVRPRRGSKHPIRGCPSAAPASSTPRPT